jgi:hypothetical protein
MAHAQTWNAAFQAIPPDTEDISRGAERIRDLKEAIQERIAKDHYFDMSGTNDDHGEHLAVTLREQAADPANVANKGFVYTKEVGGKAELFYLDEDGNAVQLTTGGSINVSVPASFASGTKMWFYQNTAPTDWTYLSAITDRCLAVKGGTGSFNVNGGNEAGTWQLPNHTLTLAQIPAHTHSITCRSKSANGNNVRSSSGGGSYSATTGSAGSGSAHNHGLTYRPYSAVGIICEKD